MESEARRSYKLCSYKKKILKRVYKQRISARQVGGDYSKNRFPPYFGAFLMKIMHNFGKNTLFIFYKNKVYKNV